MEEIEENIVKSTKETRRIQGNIIEKLCVLHNKK